jgi:hypothetical protein
MKTNAGTASLERQYQQLVASLAGTGYISQGSVLDRATLQTPRSGYQWTRKVAGKTVTVALSAEQYSALAEAVKNRRRLQQTIKKMERLSRRILFERLPDTSHHKPLIKKVLGLI